MRSEESKGETSDGRNPAAAKRRDGRSVCKTKTSELAHWQLSLSTHVTRRCGSRVGSPFDKSPVVVVQ